VTHACVWIPLPCGELRNKTDLPSGRLDGMEQTLLGLTILEDVGFGGLWRDGTTGCSLPSGRLEHRRLTEIARWRFAEMGRRLNRVDGA